MNMMIAISFALLLLFSVLARPVRMQVFWDESACRSSDESNSPVCYESDPTHQWYVELDQCSLDNSVRVIYSDYSGEDGSVLGELKFQEIRLECTEPEGVAQAAHNMSAASVDCSGRSTGGDQSLGFVFQNLNASGIQPGWTCVIRGCYKLELTLLYDDIWVRTPSTTFTLGSGDCGQNHTAVSNRTTGPPTMATSPLTTTTDMQSVNVPTHAGKTTTTDSTTHRTVNVQSTTSTPSISEKSATTAETDSTTHTTVNVQSTTSTASTNTATVERSISGSDILVVAVTLTVVLVLMVVTISTTLLLINSWRVIKPHSVAGVELSPTKHHSCNDVHVKVAVNCDSKEAWQNKFCPADIDSKSHEMFGVNIPSDKIMTSEYPV